MRFSNLKARVLLALAVSLVAAAPAAAVTISGIEFTNWTHIEAAPTDMYGKTGDLPGLFAGAACISHTAGKSFIDKNKMAGRLAGLE